MRSEWEKEVLVGRERGRERAREGAEGEIDIYK